MTTCANRPRLTSCALICAKGGEVAYRDPHVPVLPEHALSSTALSADVLAQHDAVVLTTGHDAFNDPLILEHSRLMIDTCGRFRASSPKLLRA